MPKDNHRDAVSAEIARLLSEAREAAGLSMNRLAEKSGLSQSLISSFETGPWNPTLDSLLRISEAVGVNLGTLILQAVENVRTAKAGRK